jgi:hypothetical protein
MGMGTPMNVHRNDLRIVVILCVWASLLAAQSNSRDSNPQLDDPIRAFEAIPSDARKIAFGRGDAEFPNGGHFQGIQSYFDVPHNKQICFISHDSEVNAYFIVVAFDPGQQSVGAIRHLQYLPSDGHQPPLRHPGGMQLIGRYLVIGVEDNRDRHRSQVQFWDVSDAFHPQQRTSLTVFRESATPEDKTAGAVGIVKRACDHLLVVANWDARALDFYESNGLSLSDDACRFTFKIRWTSMDANRDLWEPDENWGRYQAVNLVCDRDFHIFLLGFNTASQGRDIIDLFSVDLSKPSEDIIRKLADKHMIFEGGVQFSYSGGIYIKSSSELSCYATERGDCGDIDVNVSP